MRIIESTIFGLIWFTYSCWMFTILPTVEMQTAWIVWMVLIFMAVVYIVAKENRKK